MDGWIKINRSIVTHWVWGNDRYLRWWLTILLYVNHKSIKVVISNDLVECNAGESFRSLDEWSRLFGCSKKTVVSFFKLLKNDTMIDTKIVGNGNRRKHLLTVVNWYKYQQTETENSPERKPKIPRNGNPTLPPNKNDKKEKNITIPSLHSGIDTEDEKITDKIPYQKIIDYYNKLMKSQVRILTKKRMNAIRAIWLNYGKEAIADVFKKACESNFLNGENDRNWNADFDWVMNVNNFVKIIEGKYTNKTNNHDGTGKNILSATEKKYIHTATQLISRAEAEQ